MLLALLVPALAQDPVDIGVIRESDQYVVQELLYPKAGRTELGLFGGVMPFDPYTVAPTLQLAFAIHDSEWVGYEAVVGVGYGLKSGVYRELERDHGVAPYAYRYLTSALAGVVWSPIYAKMNLDGARIVHHDVYLAGRGGLTVEQSMIPTGGMPFAPTLSAGLGARFFLGEGATLRVEVRDDVMLQRHKLTEEWAIEQNVVLLVGLTSLSRRKDSE